MLLPVNVDFLSVGMSSCQRGSCSHPRAYKWVQCQQCDAWWHIKCAGIPALEDYDYTLSVILRIAHVRLGVSDL